MASAAAGSPTVSVAMTTFNGAPYLEEQLDSLLAQTHRPAELVVGDDGSEDETLAILQRFSLKASFPVLVHRNSDRLGFRENFIRTAERCRSELITFCDQDDVWHADNLLKVATCFAEPDVLLTFHNARIVDGSRRTISTFYADPPAPARSSYLTLPAWSASYGFTQTFRRSLLPATALWHSVKDYFRPNTEMGHGVFFFLLATGLGSVCYLNEELAEYRQHGRNTMGSGKRTRATLVERWQYRLENRTEIYRHLAQVAVLNAELFTALSMMPAFSPLLRARATEAATAWNMLGPTYADRAVLCSASLAQRVRSFVRLCGNGAYSERTFWTFGTKGLLKDAVLGLALADLVSKYGRPSAPSADRTCRRGRRSFGLDHAPVVGTAIQAEAV
jgi:glycosyltransferase involved in cell wall biosynthesis